MTNPDEDQSTGARYDRWRARPKVDSLASRRHLAEFADELRDEVRNQSDLSAADAKEWNDLKAECDALRTALERVGAMATTDDATAWNAHQELVRQVADEALSASTPATTPATPLSYTPRGFAMYADFPYLTYANDPKFVAFTVQESSAASERKVWIGAGDDRAHLNEEGARIARDGLTVFLGEQVSQPAPEPALVEFSIAYPHDGAWNTDGAEIFATLAAAEEELDDSYLSSDVIVSRTKAGDWRPVSAAG